MHVMKRPLLRLVACFSFQAAAMHVEKGQVMMVVDAEVKEEEAAAAAAAAATTAVAAAVNNLCLSVPCL